MQYADRKQVPLVAGEGAGRENSGPVTTSTGQANAQGRGRKRGFAPQLWVEQTCQRETGKFPREYAEGEGKGSLACPADLATFMQQERQQLLGFDCDLSKRQCVFLRATLGLHLDVILNRLECASL